MATVTSFAEFLTAIAGSEDIVLANDLDAWDEDYDSISNLNVRCNIDGNGHKISNVAIYDSYGVRVSTTGKTVQNIEFKNFLVKNSGDISLLSATTATTFRNCKFGAYVNSGSVVYLVSEYTPVVNCAFDVTMHNLTVDSNGFIQGSVSKSNIIIRNASIYLNNSGTVRINSISYPLSYSALILDGCTLKTAKPLAFGAINGYLALHDCECDGALTVTGNSATSAYFCNDSDISCTVSSAVELTPAQLRSEEYLRSIGFLP